MATKDLKVGTETVATISVGVGKTFMASARQHRVLLPALGADAAR